MLELNSAGAISTTPAGWKWALFIQGGRNRTRLQKGDGPCPSAMFPPAASAAAWRVPAAGSSVGLALTVQERIDVLFANATTASHATFLISGQVTPLQEVPMTTSPVSGKHESWPWRDSSNSRFMLLYVKDAAVSLPVLSLTLFIYLLFNHTKVLAYIN